MNRLKTVSSFKAIYMRLIRQQQRVVMSAVMQSCRLEAMHR
jgi:hypothetical protein